MGLGPLAFTPARNVVLGEGASECVLLPTLLREAADVPQLPFQIAPGAANVSKQNLPDLLAEGGHVVFVLDGDDGGLKRRQLLIEAGADADRVKTYKDVFGEAVVFEDLIDPAAYVKAFNEELKRWQRSDEKIAVAALPVIGRASAVDRWCEERCLKPVSKATLCQRLAEMAANSTKVLASDKKAQLKELHDWLVSRVHGGAEIKAS